MPDEYDELCTWLSIGDTQEESDKPRNRRVYNILYTNPPPGKENVQFLVRVQGFLGTHNIQTMGNWNG